MKYLSDNALVDAYNKALELKLDKGFLTLLLNEFDKRGIDLYTLQSNNGIEAE